ncbi:alpha/beta hydrolase family protein [Polaribacter glomeratus]|uniref:Alpha/beta hydrolase n=1 Tax=Polaribacter glomeratus TaxID=102 RepID=A0A2S7WHP8_9FLAO|nr:alpha/beta hydrolase [Polaribacter glomeratus]PQJ76831.1 alpha/beta hydrolase [Polaribacter glomeratus]TXD67325.1 alpha/beta hydrolase [Polaribacter glomeratus]
MKIIKNTIIQGKHNKPILVDIFYKETNLPKQIVVFCHGYKGFKDWGAWNIMAETFAEAGFFFIKFNFSHNGGTANNPIDFSDLEAFGNNNYTKELDDLETVIDWFSNNLDIKKELNLEAISLIGHSRGGGIVLLKTNEDARIKKVITLAGVCDFEKRTATIGDLQQWKKDGVKHVLNGRTKQQMPHFYQFYEDFIKNKERFNIKKATENIEIPHLIIHGDADTSVLIEEAENLHKWNLKSEYQIIENANHVFNTSHPWKEKKASKELESTIKLCVDFLK